MASSAWFFQRKQLKNPLNNFSNTLRANKAGLWLAGGYILFSLACIVAAFLPGSDSKGRFVFLQLPIALQGGLAQEVGLASYMATLSWVGAYAVLGLPTVGLLYLAGHVLSRPS